ncbi:phosphatidylinositol-specific phospholipase C [Parabacteroides sp. PF5-6]|uniref:phosphatidylinositol-specific phospholipase C n=1 Tax=Parabacteroides sp. PF5-6 TaxID=1742403 RepID=UPI002404A0AE|nr:phosphatidylinositol-specific phospholipase C [Parabacteroides sp. PF5-6]MDF9829094.1 hypothetical protein [Parabacteroides sp. PF5-6]
MKKFKFALILLSALSFLATGCDDDTPIDENPPLVGASTDEATRTVTSERRPMKGEDERSSDNFSTKDMISGTHILWNCPDTVNFDVKEDYRWPENGGKDEYYARNLTNGSITQMTQKSNLYIANPKGAGGKFNVEYTVFTAHAGYEYISSRHKPHADQERRSSFNFSLNNNLYTHYLVECPEGISFTIQKDKTSAKDEIVQNRVRNGMIIISPRMNDLYISDPSGATKPFVVCFVPTSSPAESWMKHLDGKKYLYELSIPGTHDSGTGTDKVSAGPSKCQNFSLATQLRDGIRFLDIRIDDNFQVCHGIDYCGFSFTDALKTCNSFLEKHPSETILMSVKGENGGTLTKQMEKYFADDTNPINKVFKEERIPTLDEVRGKIVILRRFAKPQTGQWGVNIYDQFPEDSVGIFTNHKNSFYVEDMYLKFLKLHKTEKKADAIDEAIALSTKDRAYSKHMFILFNSIGYGINLTHTPWSYAWDGGVNIKPIMNPFMSGLLKHYLKDRKAPVRVGIIPLDFYNKHGHDDNDYIVYKIINTNFAKDLIVLPEY